MKTKNLFYLLFFFLTTCVLAPQAKWAGKTRRGLAYNYNFPSTALLTGDEFKDKIWIKLIGFWDVTVLNPKAFCRIVDVDVS